MSTIPNDVSEYMTVDYWEKRYMKDVETHEWFKSLADFKQVLSPYLPPITSNPISLINMGCGNSSLSQDLYQMGFYNIINIDFSTTLIDHLKSKYCACSGMSFVAADIRYLDAVIASESVDVVIDKGTLDALLVNQKDIWNFDAASHQDAFMYLDQVYRILKPEIGQFIHITIGQPHFRLPLLKGPSLTQAFEWEIKVETFGDSWTYFIYILKKK